MEAIVESDWATIPEHRRGSSTVLIVDDHQDKRHLLACILQKNNFSVLEAENGSIALSMLEDLQPDVVLLDVLMPELDGFEVCRRMKRHPKIAEIPVLFVTVLDHEQNRVEGLELGGEDFINWPINASELVARINARIRSHRPLHELRTVGQEQSRLLEEERQSESAREYELEPARLVQQRFIAGAFPEERGLKFASCYRPSGQVGGDLFDVVPLNTFEVAILMGDVSGHGVPAALLTSVVKVLFRTGIEQCVRPATLLRWLNRQVRAYLTTGEFLTVFLGVWNLQTRLFSYAGAGHPPALIVSPESDGVERLHVSQGVVGIMPDQEVPRATIRLRPGHRLICYTDGITEAMNGQQELFGEDRLADICARSRRIPVDVMVQKVFAQLDQFLQGEPQSDDQALLAMEITE